MKLQMLKPRVNTIPGRMQVAATMVTKRIRGSAHQAIRDRILRRDCGTCQCPTCKRTGDLRLAHDVDHTVPLWAGGEEANENRLSLNRDCHAEKTKCEARMRAAGGWLATPCICGRHEGAL